MEEVAAKPGPPPDTIRLVIRCWRGPFTGQRTVALPPRTALIVTEATELLTVESVSADTWQSENGLTAPSALRAHLILMQGQYPRAYPARLCSPARCLPHSVTAVVAPNAETPLRLDFGDGSPPVTRTAEE